MAYRDKLLRNVTAFLEEGEQPLYVFPAVSGVRPPSRFVVVAMPRFISSWTIVAVTDRAVVVFDSRWPSNRVRKQRGRFPRTPLGPPGNGYYTKLRLPLEPPIWVWRPFYGEVHAADSAFR